MVAASLTEMPPLSMSSLSMTYHSVCGRVRWHFHFLYNFSFSCPFACLHTSSFSSNGLPGKLSWQQAFPDQASPYTMYPTPCRYMTCHCHTELPFKQRFLTRSAVTFLHCPQALTDSAKRGMKNVKK